MSLLTVWRRRAIQGAIMIRAIVAIDNGVSFVFNSAASIAIRTITYSSVRRCYILGGIYVIINT